MNLSSEDVVAGLKHSRQSQIICRGIDGKPTIANIENDVPGIEEEFEQIAQPFATKKRKRKLNARFEQLANSVMKPKDNTSFESKRTKVDNLHLASNNFMQAYSNTPQFKAAKQTTHDIGTSVIERREIVKPVPAALFGLDYSPQINHWSDEEDEDYEEEEEANIAHNDTAKVEGTQISQYSSNLPFISEGSTWEEEYDAIQARCDLQQNVEACKVEE